MKEIIDFLTEKAIDAHWTYNGVIHTISLQLPEITLKITVTEVDTLEDFKTAVNKAYKQHLFSVYNFHSSMADSYKNKIETFDTII